MAKLAKLKALPDFSAAIPNTHLIPIETKKGKETIKSEFTVQIKPVLLLLAHMYGLLKENDLDNEQTRRELEVILRKIPAYLDIVIMITMWLNAEHKQGRNNKKITCKNVIALIQFSQNLMQGGWIDKDPFMMLPHVGKSQSEALKQVLPKGTTLHKYATMSELERKSIMFQILQNNEQKFKE